MAIGNKVSDAIDSVGGAMTGDEDRAKGAGSTMNALDLLKADHKKVKRLFDEVLADESSALKGQRATVERILAELELHAKVEESIFYPAVQAKTKRDTDDREAVLEAAEEHASMKDIMRRIKKSTGRDDTLRAKVTVLKEIVAHHVEEEESELFPEAKRLLGDKKLDKLGAQIAETKARAERRRTPSGKATTKAREKRA